MSYRRLDNSNDWTFGQGISNYANRSEEIRLNLATRLRMYVNDWFLDQEEGIDYLSILGNLNNRNILQQEVIRITSETLGVKNIVQLDINVQNNKATISFTYEDIYNEQFLQEIGIANDF